MTVAEKIDEQSNMGPPPEVHPAALMFPTQAGDTQYVRRLARYITTRGVEPIVLAPDGRLLEGRGRLAAYQQLGRRPITRIERGINPYLFILRTNRRALLDLPTTERAIVVGHVPPLGMVGTPGNRGVMEPPSRAVLAQLSELSTTAISRAQQLHQQAIPELIALAATGRVALNTATRVSLTSPETQARFVARVRAGESPKTVASSLTRHVPKTPSGPTASTTYNRYQYVKESALRQLVDSFASLNLILDAATDLDPAVTPEDADNWLLNLTQQHSAYRRILQLLRQRKDAL